MRPFLLAPVVLAALSLPTAAFAQDAARSDSCPDGEWFCSTDDSSPTESASPPAEDVSDPTVWVQPGTPQARTPPVVIVIVPEAAVESAPARQLPVHRHRVFVRKPTPNKTSVPAAKKLSDEPRGGFDIHVQHLAFFDAQTQGSAAPDASLLGGGAALRIPARRNLEIHVGNSGLFGKDFNGFERGEIGFALYAQRHFNPDSRLRFYSLVGGVVAFGHVTSKQRSPLLPTEGPTGDFYANYGLLSGQAGFGTELRLASFLSVHVDALASIRWRFTATEDAPEYIDQQTGSATNMYPGLLLRGGVAFW